KLNEVLRRRDDGALAGPERARETLGAYLHRWLGAIRGTIRASTWTRYAQCVRCDLVPALGRTRLAALRPDAVQKLYAEKLAAGLAPRSVHHIHPTLPPALAQAVKGGSAGRNVTDVVDPPRVPRYEHRILAPEQAAGLLDAARGDRLEALWTLALCTGA